MMEHKKGIGAHFTSQHLPVDLIYYEECPRIEDAFQREKQIQGWSRRKKEALMNRQKEKLVNLARNYSQFGVPK